MSTERQRPTTPRPPPAEGQGLAAARRQLEGEVVRAAVVWAEAEEAVEARLQGPLPPGLTRHSQDPEYCRLLDWSDECEERLRAAVRALRDAAEALE